LLVAPRTASRRWRHVANFKRAALKAGGNPAAADGRRGQARRDPPPPIRVHKPWLVTVRLDLTRSTTGPPQVSDDEFARAGGRARVHRGSRPTPVK
jgi:hypothetical protein